MSKRTRPFYSESYFPSAGPLNAYSTWDTPTRHRLELEQNNLFRNLQDRLPLGIFPLIASTSAAVAHLRELLGRVETCLSPEEEGSGMCRLQPELEEMWQILFGLLHRTAYARMSEELRTLPPRRPRSTFE